MGKLTLKERTAAREQKIIEKFGPNDTQEKIVNLCGTTYGIYTYDEHVYVINYDEGNDFPFEYLSEEEQESAIEKLITKGEYELGVQPL